MTGQGKPQWMNKGISQKIQQPPKSIEEFLKYQNWDYWPRKINLGETKYACMLSKMKEDSSFTSIYSHLWENVPRLFEEITNMDSRLRECSLLLQDHASKIFQWNRMISKTSYKNLERYKTFLKKNSKQRKIMLSDEMETEKNIEGRNFSGFKANEVSQLPRHLDAKRIYLFILKAHNFNEKTFKIWKTHFLSEASIALLQDSFWWWFLYKFKPDQKNQDYLFDRISESYVTLFISIPLSRKDAFLRVYPDCLSQAIYAAFQEAFPESSNLFNDEFKEDLGNNIYLWLSGLKPKKDFWTHWKLKELSTTTIHGSKRAPAKSMKERVANSHERMLATMDFNMEEILKKQRGYSVTTVKEESRPTIKSHYGSLGPEFHSVLFNFGGQSPLILYYIKMHEQGGISKAPRQTKVRITEILREPTEPAPTYQEIIKEAKRQFTKNQKDFRVEKQRTNEEIKLLRQQQERIDQELDRLQKKATKKPQEAKNDLDKFLHKLRIDAKAQREFTASYSPSSSSIMTEDCYLTEEEEYLGNQN